MTWWTAILFPEFLEDTADGLRHSFPPSPRVVLVSTVLQTGNTDCGE